MSGRNDPLAALVVAERDGPSPDTQTLARVWSGVEDQLHAGMQGPVLDTAPLLPAATGLGKLWLVVALLGFVGIGTAAAARTPQPAVLRGPSLARLVLPARPAPTPTVEVPDPLPDVPPQPATAPAAPERKREARPSRRRSKPSIAPAPKASSLTEELVLMRSIERALSKGDTDRADRLVRRHVREFPQGSMIEERSAAVVRIACLRNDDAATTHRKAFERQWPASVHRAAIRNACTD